MLREIEDPLEPDEAPIVRELEDIREQLLSRSDSKDTAALTQQWNRQSALLVQLRSARGGARVDPNSPYFAHLRLLENGRERDLCLGRATCIEGGLRIVDWRNAPISKIFYRYQQGEEYEEALGDRIHSGEVLARRTVNIREASLERVESPEGIFVAGASGSDEWVRIDREKPSLSGGEASALRAREPDENAPQLGTPGYTGRADKHLPEITSLIDPEQFELITRPSTGFLAIRGTAGSGKTTVALHRIAYLAFDDAQVDSSKTLVTVFSPALRNYVGHVLPSLGLSNVEISTLHSWLIEQRQRHFPQLPRRTREDTPALVQRLKLHPVMEIALTEQVRRVRGSKNASQALDDWASALTAEKLLIDTCAEHTPGAFSTEEIRRFVEWNQRRNEELFARLEGDSESHPELDPEDDSLLLRAWQLRVGPLRLSRGRPLRYRHIAIDEVQDFSPLEVQPGTAVETLRVSYRSTQQILGFALTLLGDLLEDDEPPVATRSGPPVELFRFTDRGACVAFLGDALQKLSNREPLASVAILTPTPESSALYCEGLAKNDLLPIRRVENQDFSFAPGIEVTEVEQVKGLEFDYVILVDVDDINYPDAAPSRRRLHVGATRAVHQLWLTTVGTPSSLLGAVSPAN
jgi:DNA helicase-2/ATP-dependent DNA helicase PcrA